MNKLFIDCDILLDLLANREPYVSFSAELFTQAEENKLTLYISPLAVANIYYILCKLSTKAKAFKSVSKINLLVNIAKMDEKIVEQAITANQFTDFEDALQYYTALGCAATCIITRNKKDYKNSIIPVYTAKEFLGL